MLSTSVHEWRLAPERVAEEVALPLHRRPLGRLNSPLGLACRVGLRRVIPANAGTHEHRGEEFASAVSRVPVSAGMTRT